MVLFVHIVLICSSIIVLMYNKIKMVKKNCKLNNNDRYKRIFSNANKISRIPKYFKKSVTHSVTKCL